MFVPAYRCGAVPDFHRVPYSARSDRATSDTRRIVPSSASVNYILWIPGRFAPRLHCIRLRRNSSNQVMRVTAADAMHSFDSRANCTLKFNRNLALLSSTRPELRHCRRTEVIFFVGLPSIEESVHAAKQNSVPNSGSLPFSTSGSCCVIRSWQVRPVRNNSIRIRTGATTTA